MSQSEKKDDNKDAGGVIKHEISVSTSDREKELGKTKDTLIGDKAKLELQLQEIKDKYNSEVDNLKTELGKATEDLGAITLERDDYSQKFTVLAMKRYEAEKQALIYMAKDAVSEEKLNEIKAQIDSPEKLDKMKWFVTNLVEQLNAGRNAALKDTNKSKAPPDPDNKGAGGTGNVTLSRDDTITSNDLMKKQFSSKKEMIDYVYDQAARGKTVTRRVSDGKGGTTTVEERIGKNVEAENILDQLWMQYAKSEQAISGGKTVYTMCFKCKGLYDKSLGVCPICGISLLKGPDTDEHNIKEAQ